MNYALILALILVVVSISLIVYTSFFKTWEHDCFFVWRVGVNDIGFEFSQFKKAGFDSNFQGVTPIYFQNSTDLIGMRLCYAK